MKFEPLSKAHDRTDFVSGQPAVDDFLKTKALNHQKANVSKTFVWSPDDDRKIGAFYTLSYHTIERDVLPKSGQYPLYPLPVCKLGWLAIDDRIQGRGLGTEALVVALRHGCNWLTATAGLGVVIDATDQRTFDWYNSKEFMRPLPNSSATLIVDLKSLKNL